MCHLHRISAASRVQLESGPRRSRFALPGKLVRVLCKANASRTLARRADEHCNSALQIAQAHHCSGTHPERHGEACGPGLQRHRPEHRKWVRQCPDQHHGKLHGNGDCVHAVNWRGVITERAAYLGQHFMVTVARADVADLGPRLLVDRQRRCGIVQRSWWRSPFYWRSFVASQRAGAGEVFAGATRPAPGARYLLQVMQYRSAQRCGDLPVTVRMLPAS